MEVKVFIPKCAKSLAKFVGKDMSKPVMQYVMLDAVRGFIAACDCYVLRKINVSVEGDTTGMDNVLIDTKHIAKVAGKTVNLNVDECNEVQRVTLTCDGTDYVTECKATKYPNVLAVIPARDGYNDITLSKEGMNALKDFCKLNGKFNTMFFSVDCTKMYVYCKDIDFGRLNSICLDLDGNTGVEGTFAISPNSLATCLDGNDGVISILNNGRPFLFGGAADVTMAMPMRPEYADVSCEHHAQSFGTFAEDMKGIESQLREVAMEAWNEILCTHKNLVPGTYDAKELTKKEPECGMIYYHCSDVVTSEYGCIKVQCTRGEIFAILAQYEKVAKCDKTQFVVPGEVAKKERVNVLLNEDGEVLEKTITITEITENVYTHKYKQKGYGERAKVIFKISGVYFEASDTNVFNIEKENFVSRSKQIYDNARITMQRLVEEGSVFFREVAKRIGEAKEVTGTAQEAGVDVRAKVLQYKSDGNTLAEKRHNLAKIREGVYFSPSDIDNYVNIVLSKNGVFWKAGSEPAAYFSPEHPNYERNMGILGKMHAEYETRILHAAEKGEYIRLLEIEVMRRLGYDTAPLYASREAYLHRKEDEERQQAEAHAKAEQERKEAEQRRKAEVLADGKEKLLSHKGITVEQIELIADAVGYKINIRTIGFMREKVSEVVLRENGIVSVWGRKLTSRNIDGTAKVMHELYEQVEKQPATPTETPQNSTETAETANVPEDGENAAERAKNKPETYAGMEAYNVEYYVRRFGTIANLDKEYGAAMDVVRCEKDEYYFNRHKGGRFRTERISELDRKLKALLLEWMQIRRTMNEYLKEHSTAVTEPPQSPEVPQTVQHTITTLKHRHRANLAANMAYNETNIYTGVPPPRKNVYLCAKTLWEKQRLRSRERTRVAGRRKYTCPLQE